MARVTQTRAEQKEQTRHRILAAALDAFAAGGYFGTTMEAIAERAGTSKGALYVHFPGKESVFLALLDLLGERLWAAVQRALAAEAGAAAKIAAVLRAVLEVFAAEPNLARLALIEAAVAGPAAQESVRRLRRGFTQSIRQNVQRLVAEGKIPPADDEVVAAILFGSVQQLVLDWLEEGAGGDLRALAGPLTRHHLRAIGLDPQERGEEG